MKKWVIYSSLFGMASFVFLGAEAVVFRMRGEAWQSLARLCFPLLV
jgi:hypothetical protein